MSSFIHPFDIARDPDLDTEIKRALLASWASDAASVESAPALRRPAGVREPIPVDDVLAALRALDGCETARLRA